MLVTNIGFFIFPQNFAIFDDFSKWIVPKVIKNTIPIEKSSNMAKIWGKMKKPGNQLLSRAFSNQLNRLVLSSI